MTDRDNWPRVTSILKDAGLYGDMRSDEHAMARGTAVHMACEFYDEGDLDTDSVTAEVMPYISAWATFKRETGCRIESDDQGLIIERSVWHPTLMYRGTLDRIATVNSKPYVLDVKSGSPWPPHPIQTGLYSMAWAAMHDIPYPRRACVYLTADGKYKFDEHKNRQDYNIAKACITLANWRNGHA
jgi:hypothetical protein